MKNLLVLAASLAICALAGEGLARLLLPPHPIYYEPQPRHDPHPVLGWTLRPSQRGFTQDREMRSNAQGLRDAQEVPAEKSPGERRILVLGDSFTFGNGVADDETYAEGLEARLRARGIPARSLNAGVQGYDLHQAAEWLTTRGVALQPDLVVSGVFVNDIVLRRRPEVAAASLLAAGDLGEDSAGDALRRRAVYAVKRLRSVVFLSSALRELRWRLFPPEGDYHTAALFYERVSAESEQAWAEVGASLARIRDTARAAGCEVLVVVFPQHGQLAAGPLERTYQGRLLSLLRELGLEAVDLLPVYRAAAAEGRNPFIPYDGHPNAAGHGLAADALLGPAQAALARADDPLRTP